MSGPQQCTEFSVIAWQVETPAVMCECHVNEATKVLWTGSLSGGMFYNADDTRVERERERKTLEE